MTLIMPYKGSRRVPQFYPSSPGYMNYGDLLDQAGATGELRDQLRSEMREQLVRSRLQTLINHHAEMNALSIAARAPVNAIIFGNRPMFSHRMGGVLEKSYYIPGRNKNMVTSRWTRQRDGHYANTTPFDRNPSPEGIARTFGLTWESPFARI